jgi:hypothetical protein
VKSPYPTTKTSSAHRQAALKKLRGLAPHDGDRLVADDSHHRRTVYDPANGVDGVIRTSALPTAASSQRRRARTIDATDDGVSWRVDVHTSRAAAPELARGLVPRTSARREISALRRETGSPRRHDADDLRDRYLYRHGWTTVNEAAVPVYRQHTTRS